MNRFVTRFALGAALSLGVAGSFYAGIAYASDPKLDQAIDNCSKAIALLEAATNQGAKNKENFNGHRRKAIDELKDAVKQIEKAKTYDDKTPAPASSG
jgi:tetratricopeptide (TPR) repeat protein